MAGRQCYHCKAWVNEGDAHDCWTTTESALTADLPEELREAWERLRETAAGFGEQRIYASHSSIMFSRKACYFFVRPKKACLEVCLFLGRGLNAPQVRRVDSTSKIKFANMLRIMHRDEVEPPVTDWLREAYDFANPTNAARHSANGTIDASRSSQDRYATSTGGRVAKKAASRAKRSSSAKGGRKRTAKGAKKSSAKRGSSKRSTVDTGRNKMFAKRTAKGRFKEMDDVGRSLSTDRRRTAKKKTKSGYGDQGDRKKR
jgi:hypothetical protein